MRLSLTPTMKGMEINRMFHKGNIMTTVGLLFIVAPTVAFAVEFTIDPESIKRLISFFGISYGLGGYLLWRGSSIQIAARKEIWKLRDKLK